MKRLLFHIFTLYYSLF